MRREPRKGAGCDKLEGGMCMNVKLVLVSECELLDGKPGTGIKELSKVGNVGEGSLESNELHRTSIRGAYSLVMEDSTFI